MFKSHDTKSMDNVSQGVPLVGLMLYSIHLMYRYQDSIDGIKTKETNRSNAFVKIIFRLNTGPLTMGY